MSVDKLFQTIRIGSLSLPHRVIMAPLTRFRADENHVLRPFVKEYYTQRASVPGTLIITEATFISANAGGYDRVPGIWNDAQVAAWKEVVDAVHAKGCFIYCQLWALGRVATKSVLERDGFDLIGPSAVPVDESKPVPKEMSESQILAFVGLYKDAARRAMEAGFDGVEIHGANGYLIDQFWQTNTNHRTDSWGGSISARARFGLEVTKAIIEAVGTPSKVGMRLSPWGTSQRMRMPDPIPQFSHIISELKKLDIAYLHLVESRIGYNTTALEGDYHELNEENTPFIELWGKDKPVLLAGGFTAGKARKVLNELYVADNVCIAFGRYFISTPDLPFRIKEGLPLSPYHRETFYSQGEKGYTDYPVSEEFLRQQKDSKI